MQLYEIWNSERNSVYIGITRVGIKRRYAAHRYGAKTKVTPLYCAMRKHGFETFSIRQVAEFTNESFLKQAERDLIASYRLSSLKVYNILDGGDCYFPIEFKDVWVDKMKKNREGRKPALGMKHTEENKKFFSECGKARWDKYGRYPSDIIDLPFKEAKAKYGISKTHYYRLKLVGNNDSN